MVVAVQQRYGSEGAGLYASAIAYHAFFSLLPLLLVGLAILGFVLDDPETQRRFVEQLTGTVPGLQTATEDTVGALVRARAAAGILGLLGLAWTGTQVVRAAGRSLTQLFRIEIEGDNIVKQNLWALGSLAGLGLLASVAAGVSLLGSNLPSGNAISSAALVAVGFAVDMVLFAVAYRVLTRGRGPAMRALLPGATLAAAGWTLLKVIGSWYARRAVTNAAAVYGTFAAAIGILVILSVGARFFLYGAVFNLLRMREHPNLQSDAMRLPSQRDGERTSQSGKGERADATTKQRSA